MAKVDQVISTSVDVAEDAFYIFAGAVAGKYVMDMLSNALPMVSAYGNIGGLVIGAFGATMTSGIVRKLSLGFALSSALGAMDQYLSPVVETVVPTQ